MCGLYPLYDICMLAGIDEESWQIESEFSDVSENAYYAPFVAWAKKYGVTGGVGDGKFAPNQPVTRQEMATFFVRYFEAFGVKYDTGKTIDTIPEDIESVAQWAKESVLKLWSVGLLNGDGKILLVHRVISLWGIVCQPQCSSTCVGRGLHVRQQTKWGRH